MTTHFEITNYSENSSRKELLHTSATDTNFLWKIKGKVFEYSYSAQLSLYYTLGFCTSQRKLQKSLLPPTSTCEGMVLIPFLAKAEDSKVKYWTSSNLEKVKDLAFCIWGVFCYLLLMSNKWFFVFGDRKWSSGVEVVNLPILEAYSTSGTNPKLLGTIYGQMNEASLQFLLAAESVSKRVMTTCWPTQHTMIANWGAKIMNSSI